MTDDELATFVIRRWLDDHAPKAIMMQLVCLGRSVSKSDVLAVVRRYIDLQTENKTYTRTSGD